MSESHLVRIEMGTLEGVRPRKAGRNARLNDHGADVRVPIVRITMDDGSSGFGVSRANPEDLATLLGSRLPDVGAADEEAMERWLPVEFPLWDLLGKRQQIPVYRLLIPHNISETQPLRAPCYDTSLYIDDLHLQSDDEAADLIAAEAIAGYTSGHRAFKLKLGRGARHMDLEAGTRRDVLVVRAVRGAIGPDARLMLDANNGYNLNLTKRVLAETADCRIHWMEEAFHEDAVLYTDLQEWLKKQGLPILIAEGEGQASPSLLAWARDGIIDVVQYDILSHGLYRWLGTGRQLDAWNVSAAPHHYGTGFGNYAACHLAAAIEHFQFVEWDEAAVAGLGADGYTIEEGYVSVPEAPGFGLELDEDIYSRAVAASGHTLTLESQAPLTPYVTSRALGNARA